MAKPTRKHPALTSLAENPQGVEFPELIQARLGSEEAYTAVAALDRERRHPIMLERPMATALLSEAWKAPEGSEARPR